MLKFFEDCKNNAVFWLIIALIFLIALLVKVKTHHTNCTKINNDVKKCIMPNGDICYMWNDGHHGSGMSCKFKDK